MRAPSVMDEHENALVLRQRASSASPRTPNEGPMQLDEAQAAVVHLKVNREQFEGIVET